MLSETELKEKLGITEEDKLIDSNEFWLPWDGESGASVLSFIKRRLSDCITNVRVSSEGEGAVFEKVNGNDITIPFAKVETEYGVKVSNFVTSSLTVSSFSTLNLTFNTEVTSTITTGSSIVNKSVEIGPRSSAYIVLYDNNYAAEVESNFDSAFKISVDLGAETTVDLNTLLKNYSLITSGSFIIALKVYRINGNENITSPVIVASDANGRPILISLLNFTSSYLNNNNIVTISTSNDVERMQYYLTLVGTNSASLLTLTSSSKLWVLDLNSFQNGVYTFAYRLISNNGSIFSPWTYKIIVKDSGGIYLEDLGNYKVKLGEYSKICSIHNTEGLTGDYRIYMYVNNTAVYITNSNYLQNVYNVSEFNFDASSLDGITDQHIYVKNNVSELDTLFYIYDINTPEKSFLWKQLANLADTTGASLLVSLKSRFTIDCIPITNSIYGKYIIPQYDATLISDFSKIFNTSSTAGSDGFVYKDKRPYFKVSPSSGNIFSDPGFNFNKLFDSDFSATFSFRAENINDLNKPLFNLGNLTFYPGFARINANNPDLNNDADLYYSSLADYKYDYDSNEEKTNIIVTFQKNYKPTTYDYNFIYDDKYTDRYIDVNSKYDCLKIFVNGTINRVIPIVGKALGSPYFLVNSSSAVLKIYDFKLWSNKVLNYEEIITERINAYDSIADKENYIKDNLIYYTLSDVNSGNSQLNNLYGRISLNKCLGKKVFNNLGSSLPTSKKNILLFVLGNKDGKDARPLNFNYPKDTIGTSILIKYKNLDDTDYDLDYSGLLCSNGTAASKDLHKAQGSSAKKYAGAYNDLYSDFYFISETNHNNLTSNWYYQYDLKEESKEKEESALTFDDYKVNQDLPGVLNVPKVKVWDAETSKLIETEVLNPQIKEENVPKVLSYYQLKGEDFQITKLVGKVNIASSQQSHKLGCCKLYNEAYKLCVNSDISYRKAVHEEPFYYFYITLSDINKDRADGDKVTLSTVSWDDITDTIALNAHFFGMITWGSAKADKKTFNFDKKQNIIFEGADNENACTNFKVPWAALQIWNTNAIKRDIDDADKFRNLSIWDSTKTFTFNGKTYIKPKLEYVSQYVTSGQRSYTDNLFVFDDTIMYRYKYSGENDVNASPDSWDISGGTSDAAENATVKNFTATGKEIVKSFAQFYDLIYTFDFANLELIPTDIEGNNLITSNLDITKKYIMPLGTKQGSNVNIAGTNLNLRIGDTIRYDLLSLKWVHAGLNYSTSGWERLNVIDIANALYNHAYGSGAFNYIVFPLNLSKLAKTESGTEYINLLEINIENQVINNPELISIKQAFSEVFKQILDNYFVNGVKEIAFHQAMMRVLNGTDNRAKNTYYISRKNTASDASIIPYKFEMFLDDLDTVAKTDNNGLQTKTYDLMEPPYNSATKNRWGDQWSGLFTNVDLVLEEEIREALEKIIQYYSANNDILISVAKYFPSIAYNHTSEIYYEVPLLLMHDNNLTNFATLLKNFYENGQNKFNNNGVANPASLSHGSCLECEELFYKDRFTLLASYCNISESYHKGQITVTNSTGSGVTKSEPFTIDNLSYNINLYPYLLGVHINPTEFDKVKYITPIQTAGLPNIYSPYISLLAVVSDDKYTIETESGASLTGATNSMYNTDAVKTIKISGDIKFDSYDFKNASEFEIERKTLAVYSTNNVDFSENLPSAKSIKLSQLDFQGDVVSFKNCEHLTTLVLNGCKINTLILPNNTNLETLGLHNCEIKTIIIPSSYPRITFTGTHADIENISINAENSDKFICDIISLSENYESFEFTKLTNKRVVSKNLASYLVKYNSVEFIGGTKVVFNDINWDIKKALYENASPKLTKDKVEITGETNFSNSNLTAAQSITVSIDDARRGIIPNYRINISNTGGIVPTDITYEYSGTDFSVEASTGKILYLGYQGVQSKPVNILVKKVICATVNVTIGVRIPAKGDFVYEDLTFSEFYNPNKQVLGLIYYVDSNKKEYKMLSSAISQAYPVTYLTGLYDYYYVGDQKQDADEIRKIVDGIIGLNSEYNNLDSKLNAVYAAVGIAGSNIIDEALKPISTVLGHRNYLYAFAPLYQYAKKISTPQVGWNMLTTDEWTQIINWIKECNQDLYSNRNYLQGELKFVKDLLLGVDSNILSYFRFFQENTTIARPNDTEAINRFSNYYNLSSGYTFWYPGYNFNPMNNYQTYYTATIKWT